MHKERPILFKAEMVNAILAGRKTQTRRVVKKDLAQHFLDNCIGKIEFFQNAWGCRNCGAFHYDDSLKCPYGKPGDLLWMRETWRPEELDNGEDGIRFRADSGFKAIDNTQDAAEKWFQVYSEKENWKLWRPSIYMPRWASRITLEITDVRVERVQDITRDSAIEEGITEYLSEFSSKDRTEWNDDLWRNRTTIENFRYLWNSINKKRGFGWDENPWVWVIEWGAKHATPNN